MNKWMSVDLRTCAFSISVIVSTYLIVSKLLLKMCDSIVNSAWCIEKGLWQDWKNPVNILYIHLILFRVSAVSRWEDVSLPHFTSTSQGHTKTNNPTLIPLVSLVTYSRAQSMNITWTIYNPTRRSELGQPGKLMTVFLTAFNCISLFTNTKHSQARPKEKRL